MKALRMAAACLATALAAGSASAQEVVKVGLIVSMTGQQASTGKQIKAAVDLYMKEHGDMVAGKKIQVILRDTATVVDNAKRLAQELIVNDKVAVIAGFEVTPAAMAIAPLATEAKVPAVVMAAGTSAITERSPYITRTSFTLPQSSVIIADWAAKNNIKKVVTIVSDYAPGADAEKWFIDTFKKAGGDVTESLKVPLMAPDFAPFLQRAADVKPDAIFIFVPSGQGANFMKQYAERGLDKAGIKVIGPGDVTDDDLLPQMGDAVLGVVTAHMYSADHPSEMNMIYEAVKKTGGKVDGDSLIAAMKGMQWESPRGPMSIDPDTRDVVQNIYMRKVEKKNGQLYNVEFQTFDAVKDPAKVK
jgi:branched-chain amino acid transport system substrate-binding protein